jgi:transport and Golgi organization protein 2
MCTVSFLPGSGGFYLAMNRDEKRSRPIASPPEIVDAGNCRAVFPRDPRGGSWIAASEMGVCLALINWHRIERVPHGEIATRGDITARLAGARSSRELTIALMNLPLRAYRPFRLIAIVPREHRVTEWRWDLEVLTTCQHRWERQHWFSSGFNEVTAEFERARLCEGAFENGGAVGLESLRRLHQSHAPRRGPFSICMHRSDAVTVSYTEVVVSDGRVVMRYKNGAPCSGNSALELSLPSKL